MPKNKKSKRNKRATGFGPSGSNIIRVPFRYVRYVTAGSAAWTVAYINLRPDQLGSKLVNIKDAYQLYRFVSLRIKSVFPLTGSFPSSTTAGASHAVAWSGEYLTNNPAFYDAMSEFPRFEIGPCFHPVEIRLSRRELVGEDPLKWFRTDQDEPSGTAAEDFTTQGYMFWASYIDNGATTGSFRHFAEFEGEVEFCQPKNTSLDSKDAYVPAPEAKKFMEEKLPTVNGTEISGPHDHKQASVLAPVVPQPDQLWCYRCQQSIAVCSCANKLWAPKPMVSAPSTAVRMPGPPG